MPRIGNHKAKQSRTFKYQPKLVGTKKKHAQFARRKQKDLDKAKEEMNKNVDENGAPLPKPKAKKNVSVCLLSMCMGSITNEVATRAI